MTSNKRRFDCTYPTLIVHITSQYISMLYVRYVQYVEFFRFYSIRAQARTRARQSKKAGTIVHILHRANKLLIFKPDSYEGSQCMIDCILHDCSYGNLSLERQKRKYHHAKS